MAAETPTEQWKNIQGRVQEALQSYFPFEGRSKKLVLHNIAFDEKEAAHNDIRSQEQAKDLKRTWGVPIFGDIGIVDKITGQEIDRAKVRLLTLPKPTNRYSYIVDGSEWQVDNMWRLRSGVYANIHANAKLSTEFNLAPPGFAQENRLHVPFDPKTKQFKLKYGGSLHAKLYSVLKMMGVPDEDMKKAWGEDIYKANVHAKVQEDILKFHGGLQKRGVRAETQDYEGAATALLKEFDKTRLLPEVTKISLGKPLDRVTGEALLLASTKILGVAKGEIPPDDRNSLVFKTLHGVDDFLYEKLTNYKTKKTVNSKLLNIDRVSSVRTLISGDLFNKQIKDFFTSSTLSRNPEQVNPLEMISNHRSTTIIGEEGGIKNERAVLPAMKVINPSHFGFLDPLHTPESEKTGINLNLPLGVKKVGNEAKVQVYDLVAKKLVRVGPAELHSKNVVLPDQVTISEKGEIQPIAASVKMKDAETGDFISKPFKEGHYLIPSAHQLFDEATNLIPFLQNDQGNRTSVAARQLTQAMSLHTRELPLVQVQSGGQSSWERLIGIPWSHSSHLDGTVSEIKKNKDNGYAEGIVITDHAGKAHEVQIYNHFPLNEAKTLIHSTPIVKVGDQIKKGQVIADSNFTKDGHLTLGTNLRIAYIPYKGYNFEDGIVISESAAQKLTSEHMHRHTIEIDPDRDHLSKTMFSRYASTTAKKLTQEQFSKLGDDGIIQVGVKVVPGDVLIAAVGKPDFSSDTAKFVGRLGKQVLSYKDKSVHWESDHPGEVVKVVKAPNGKGATVYVKALEPAEIGDKIVGRHGNKAIITRILPNHEMPRIGSVDGIHAEVLMNPSGIPSRINLGQLLETAAGKIAQKTGKPYLVNNFSGTTPDYKQQVVDDLKKHNISDTEMLYDPQTQKALGEVLTGPQYILKLKQQVEKKLAVRSYGSGSGGDYSLDQSPKGTGAAHPGQAMGQLEFYALLAHGARHNLREMATYKADSQIDEQMNPQAHVDFWDRVRMGQPLPVPKTTFAYRKFEGYLKALGVNVHKEGNTLQLQPLTDRGILQMSNGEIKDGGRVLRGKDSKELEKGLFDPKITGGLPNAVGKGLLWSHIVLAEPVPNPIFVGTQQHPGPAVVLSGLKFRDFEEVVKGRMDFNGKTGGKAINEVLKKIDVKKELKTILEALPTLRGNARNKANQKARYLQALDKLGLHAHEAYVLNNLPVLPPIFRPVVPMPDGALRYDDVNGYYQKLALVNNQLKNPIKDLPDSANQKLREQLYDLMKATAGLGGTPVYDSNRKMKGILDIIKGEQPKDGYFQKRLMKRRQELSMRSTIIPEPAMHLDHVGLPKDAAMELYKPFVIREMRALGYSPLDAMKAMKAGEDSAWRALQRAMDKQLILLKRDPALHKFSIMAFKPKLVEGKAIQIHPLVTHGYNADFDGDSTIGEILVVTSVDSRYNGDKQEPPMPHIGEIASYQIIDLAMFPRLLETAIVKPSGVVEYNVPPHVYVPAYLNGQMKIMPVTKYSIHPNCEEWLIRTSEDRELRCSSDHSLALLDPETLEVTKKPPREALGLCVPIMRSLIEPQLFSYFQGAVPTNDRARSMIEQIPMVASVGWFIGASIGDGWITFAGKKGSTQQNRQVNLAHGVKGEEAAAYWEQVALWLSCGAAAGLTNMPHEYKGFDCDSDRTTISSTTLGLWLEPLIGKGAQNKHLPPRFLEMPEDFRRGLFCGLIDTDGSANWNERGQFSLTYNTSSKRLAEEVQLLGLSLGLHSGKTDTSTPNGKPFHIIPFSIRPVQHATWLKLICPHKQAALTELQQTHQVEPGRNDFVPMTAKAREEILNHLRVLGASLRPPNRNTTAFSLYVVLNREYPTITRESAEKLGDLFSATQTLLSEYLVRWFNIALDPTVGWDLVTEANATGQYVEMYDLTVPEAWTFTMANGAVVWDTMSAFVPLTDAAVQEARKMFPSNNLFSPTHGGIMYAPDQESLLGLHLLSKWGKKSDKSFSTYQEAVKAKEKGLIEPTDVIKVRGKNTTLGRLMIAEQLPDEVKHQADFEKLLQDPGFVLVKRVDKDKPHNPLHLGVSDLLNSIAHNHPNHFSTIVDQLKNLGNEYSYSSGYSIGLKDLDVNKPMRDNILNSADIEVSKIRALKITKDEKDEKTIKVYEGAQHELDRVFKPYFTETGNNLYAMVSSGARGKWSQFRQMNIAPMLVQDGKGKTLPTPVKKSYSEGLDIGDYWTALHGARKGTLQRVEGTSEPGSLTKEIINVVIPNLVVSHDCGTTQGISLNIHDADVHDRYLVAPIKIKSKQVAKAGDLITPELMAALKKNKIDEVIVRSPLKCLHGQGLCAKCFGLNENGHLHEIGINVGVISGHALGEPATQLAMDAFHTGGVASSRGGTSVDKFTRLRQLLGMQKKLPDEATLSQVSGKIQKIEKDEGTNGHNIWVNGEKHFAPAQRGLLFKVGDMARKGDPLTDGPINPHHLLPLTDIHHVQNYLTSELYNAIYKDERVKRRHIETVVRGLTNLTQVKEPGDSDHLHGDMALRTVVEEHNRKLAPGELPILHTPLIKGATQTALNQHEDWMARLNFRYLQDTLLEGAAKGWKTDLHGMNPIAAYAHGANFGLGTKDKPHHY